MIKSFVIAICTIFVCADDIAGSTTVDRGGGGADPLASNYGNLVFSTIIYRHGDRSIEDTYPGDPYANKSYWPMGFGQLTPIGIERHFELGKWLRKRYAGWLPEVYSTEDVYVRSTDYDRTIMSAEANLAGMYPPVGPKNWNGEPGKHVQLVPIHTVPKSQDNVLGMTADCPVYSQEFEKIDNDLHVQMFFSKFFSDLEYIKNNTNLELGVKTTWLTITLYYALTIESQFNYTLPPWTRRIFPEPLTTIAVEDFKLSTYNTILKRLKAGPLLTEIVTRMHEKKNGTLNPDRSLWIYSAHDTTMVNLLNTMGLYEHSLVPYTAVLMIELRLNVHGNHVVTISYRNTSDHEPYLLQVPGCDSVACELDTFTDVFRPVMFVDWDVECKPVVERHLLKSLVNLVWILIAAIVVTVVSYVIAEKAVFCHQTRPDYYTRQRSRYISANITDDHIL